MRWNKTEALSVLSADNRNSPTQLEQKRSDRLIDWTQSLDRNQLKVVLSLQRDLFRLFVRSCHPPHPALRDQCKSQPWSKQLSRPTSRTCRLQKESAWDHLVSWSLGVPNQLLFDNGIRQQQKLEQHVQHVMFRRFTRGLFADKAVQTASIDRRPQLCLPRRRV